MSLFSQILSEMSLSTVSFEHLVLKQGNDRNAKGFTSKAQLVAMIFSHLARADSLREITNGLLCCNGNVRHLKNCFYMSAMLRLNLFTYRPLPEWLDRPYEIPPAVPVPEQQLIFTGGTLSWSAVKIYKY